MSVCNVRYYCAVCRYPLQKIIIIVVVVIVIIIILVIIMMFLDPR